MKKLIAFVLVMVMALALCACSTEQPDVRMSDGVNRGKVIEETTTPIPVETTEETMEETDEVTEESRFVVPNDPNNVFVNLTNYVGEPGKVSINARQAVWEGENLIMECFIINNTGKTVTAFKVDKLIVSNDTQVLVDATFDDVAEVEIPDGEYIIHTFIFKGETVKGLDGDLSHLMLTFDIRHKTATPQEESDNV